MTKESEPYVERLDPESSYWPAGGADHLARYLFALQFTASREVLDAGTGSGYGAALLAAHGASRVHAIDIDEAALATAKARYSTLGIDFRVDDCEVLSSIQTPIEVACSFENLEHLAQPKRFLAAVAGCLVPEGILLCSSPDARASPPLIGGRPANPFHTQEWDEPEFRTMLVEYFAEVEVLAQVRSHRLQRMEWTTWSVQSQLRSNPLWFLKRWVLALTGRAWEPLTSLAAPSPADFPVVKWSVANLFGTPHCLVAVCRRPKRPR